MAGYRALLELIAERQLGILGEVKTREVFRESGLALDTSRKLQGDEPGLDHLRVLTEKLFDKYGPVPIMGCKIPVKHMAKSEGLELPKLLR